MIKRTLGALFAGMLLFILPANALAQSSGSAPGSSARQSRQLADKEYFTRGQYLAFAAPWCADRNKELTIGRDLHASIALDPDRFPAGVTIRSHAPSHDPGRYGCGVYAYNHVAFGNYNDGSARQPVVPAQVKAIGRLSADFDLRFSGDGQFNVLQEFFLTRNAGSHRRQVLEIGYFLHASDTALRFARGGRGYRDYTDPQGRVWKMYRVQRFLMLFPADGDLASGSIDIGHLLNELVARKLLTGDEWFNGLGLGVEPVEGDSTLHIGNWRVDYDPR
ncbi:hypothetical protein GRI97_00015 [Altererythrobacter xixiisoli]|uniref:Uncharacterized protein n=1 Tax=Croceibacterium xixiisoli TaxID=1476466 RepID=A0A6I4TPX1_9SPHN|nr:hypothetical protein [Croceibacterium xixiisoli]MXO97369.1 hypothetical protein [Croceibacterium xixiisoli]